MQVLITLSLAWTGAIAQLVELPSMHEALGSNSNTGKQKVPDLSVSNLVTSFNIHLIS